MITMEIENVAQIKGPVPTFQADMNNMFIIIIMFNTCLSSEIKILLVRIFVSDSLELFVRRSWECDVKFPHYRSQVWQLVSRVEL